MMTEEEFNWDNRDLIAGPDYVSDDEIFDDHYSYEGHEFEIGYTQILPYGIMMKIQFDHFIKYYNNKFNSTLSGISEQITRDDKKSIFIFVFIISTIFAIRKRINRENN
jgi:hypothetical protein